MTFRPAFSQGLLEIKRRTRRARFLRGTYGEAETKIMSLSDKKKALSEILECYRREPQITGRLLKNFPSLLSGVVFSQKSQLLTASDQAASNSVSSPESPNPLRDYFDAHREGRGIWKWNHYFDIYERHFRKFVGREVHLMEVGIYSGGSLDMWKAYFGPQCHVYGLDIEPACKAYEGERVKILIGDQADRDFWKSLRQQVPRVDIMIDDGGHTPHQQLVTLEETLPHIAPGGVYLCEDIHGASNDFAAYVYGLASELNAMDSQPATETPIKQVVVKSEAFQSAVHSVHLYPYVTVVEKNARAANELIAPKHGTEWQPFL